MGEREEQIVQRLVGKLGDKKARFVAESVLYEISKPEYADALAVYLNDEDKRVREAITYRLADMGDPRATASMTAIALDPKRRWRNLAHSYLGKIDPDLEVDLLIKLLGDKELGFLSASRLSIIGNQKAVEPLIAALNNEQPMIRSAAANALAKIGDHRAIEPLIAALNDDTPHVAGKVIESLAAFGEVAVEPTLKMLSHPDERNIVKRDAVTALGELGDKRAIDPLIAMIGNEDARIRAGIATALGKIGDKRAIDPLIPLLSDADDRVRLNTLVAMVRLGVAQFSQLTDLLNDPNVRHSQVIALLGELGDPRAFDTIVEAARNDPYLITDIDTARMLAAMNYEVAMLLYISLLEDRRKSRMGYDCLGRDAGVCLINILIVEKQTNPRIVAALEAMLNSKHATAREYARGTLSLLDHSRKAELFIPGLKEEDFTTLYDAVEGLYGAGPAAAEPLAELIKNEQQQSVRDLAVEVLVTCDTEKAIEIMQWLLERGISTVNGKSIKRKLVTLTRYNQIREYILTGKEL